MNVNIHALVEVEIGFRNAYGSATDAYRASCVVFRLALLWAFGQPVRPL